MRNSGKSCLAQMIRACIWSCMIQGIQRFFFCDQLFILLLFLKLFRGGDITLFIWACTYNSHEITITHNKFIRNHNKCFFYNTNCSVCDRLCTRMVCLLATFLVSSSDSGGSVVAKQPSPLLNPPPYPQDRTDFFGKREKGNTWCTYAYYTLIFGTNLRHRS